MSGAAIAARYAGYERVSLADRALSLLRRAPVTLLALLLACVATRPKAPVPGAPVVTPAWREALVDDAACAFESESLRFGALSLWEEEAPPAEGWCRAPFEHARTVDVLGQDGPYLSVRQTTRDCCPAVETSACVTYDVRSALPVTLRQYDPRLADQRLARATAQLPAGFTLERDAFLVGDGHVRFCARRGAEITLIEVP
jgi:hypothetical protein